MFSWDDILVRATLPTLTNKNRGYYVFHHRDLFHRKTNQKDITSVWTIFLPPCSDWATEIPFTKKILIFSCSNQQHLPYGLCLAATQCFKFSWSKTCFLHVKYFLNKKKYNILWYLEIVMKFKILLALDK